MTGLLFPGQGAQSVGMGAELAAASAAARDTFAEADEALGYSVSALCFDGPAERLVATDVQQPAILTVSVAAYRAAAEAGLTGDLVMGHSLGEYSALVACGSMDFADALRVVAERGAAMEQAATDNPGAMAAILGLDDDAVAALAERAGGVWLANFNCPGQVVASGTADGIDRLLAIAAEDGARATRLAVSGAFHTPLMEPAAARLAPALAAWDPSPADPEFLSTTTCAVEPPERLREVMLAQLTAPVRFGAAIEAALGRGITRFVELAPGKVLSGLVRRVRRDIETVQVNVPADLEKVAA